MDLNQYLRVFGRHRVIVACGVLLATALALLTFVKVDPANGFKLSYRGTELWSSGATVFDTQQGFPLGRSIYDEVVPVNSPGDTTYVPRYADPSRFSSYAQLYAQLTSSDLLRRQMPRNAPPPGRVSATAAVDPRNPGLVLPLVQIQGTGPTTQDAKQATNWATNALLTYIQQQQTANKIAPGKRVILRILDNPSTPTLLAGRSKTRPAFVFIAVLTACAALIFTLDNLKRQPHAKPRPLPAQPTHPTAVEQQPRPLQQPGPVEQELGTVKKLPHSPLRLDSER
jgi:hypothetical protein